MKGIFPDDLSGTNIQFDGPISPPLLETILLSKLSEKHALREDMPIFSQPLITHSGQLIGSFLFLGKSVGELESKRNEIETCVEVISAYLEKAILSSKLREMEKNHTIFLGMSSTTPSFARKELRETVNKIAEVSASLFESRLTLLYRKEDEFLKLEEVMGTPELREKIHTLESLKNVPIQVNGTFSKDWHFGFTFYQKKLEKTLLPLLGSLGLEKLIVIPIYPFGKDVNFIAHLFEPLDEEYFKKLTRMINPFSELASVAVESQLNKASLFNTMGELLEEKRRISWLLKLSTLVSSTLDVNHAMRLLVREIREFFRISRCGIILKVEKSDEGVLLFSSTEKEPFVRRGRVFRVQDYPNLSRPLITKKPLLLNHATNHNLTPHERKTLKEFSAEHILLLPVVQHGESVGLIVMVQSNPERKFTPPDVEMGAAVASQLGSTIHNATMFMNVLKSRNEWEHTFNSISDMIFILDKDFHIVNCNEIFLVRHRLSREETIGKKCYELFGCDKYPSLECEHKKCMREKKPVESFYENFQVPGVFRVKVSPILNEAGEVEKTVHLIHDITKEREIEKKLSESLKKAKETSDYLETLLDSSPDCIISADARGNIVFLNRGAQELLGYTEEELVGRHVALVYPSLEEARRVGEAMRKNGGRIRNFNSRLKKKDGTLVDVLISVATLYDENGNKAGTVGISKDVSQVKKMEEHLRQAEKLTALGKLASGIAHDFNNILTAISMRTELLKMKVKDEEILKELDVIENAAIKGSNTVDKLKTFYKRDAHGFKPVNLNSVIRESVEITSPRWKNMAESRGIHNRVTLNLDKNLRMIEGNEGELKDAFINLIINAVDAMPDGGEITIKTSSVYNSVRVEFSDTGTGMSEEVRQRAFEPFFSTKGDRGTGLGLSTVYGIITRHGGTIEIDSEPGKGTTFTITFPVARETTHQEKQDVATSAGSLSGVEVFLFEDDDGIRASLEEILRARGCVVHAFGDPETGLESVENSLKKDKNTKKKVVITDLGMPAVNGFEIARKTKMLDRKIPVIMLTGWGSFIEASHASLHGVDRIIPKPVRSDELIGILLELVSQRS